MAVIVSLRKVVDEIDILTDGSTAYLNRKTGDLYSLQDEEAVLIEDDDVDLEDLPDWQREEIPLIREILESEDWLRLPTKFDINEWSIMEGFSHSRDNDDQRNELLKAIQGKGAFRHFKETIHRLGIEESWYGFRDAALDQIAIDWLDAHEISYTRNENGASASDG